MNATPVRVAVTGAAGQIGYSLVFRIASGALLGPDQPVILQMLEIPPAMGALDGVAMELDDCAFPLLTDMVLSDDPDTAFEGTDVALLVGSRPRTAGMERQDLLEANGAIFTVQGRALNDHASGDLRVLVVGNPANTNCLIAMNSAPDVPEERFTAMMRLDHNRAMTQVAQKAGVPVTDVSRMTIWGNHSATQYPDLFHCQVGGRSAVDVIDDRKWLESDFIPTVQQHQGHGHQGRGQQRGPGGIERRGGGQCGHWSCSRLGVGDRRGRLGQHGRGVRRELRRARGSVVWVSHYMQRRPVVGRPGPGTRRVFPGSGRGLSCRTGVRAGDGPKPRPDLGHIAGTGPRVPFRALNPIQQLANRSPTCLLYTSDAADE